MPFWLRRRRRGQALIPRRWTGRCGRRTISKFANGKLARDGRHSGRPRQLGHVPELAEQAELDVRRIIETLDGRIGPERQIRDLYTSMTNEAQIEALWRHADPRRAGPHRRGRFTEALARQIGHLSAINAGGPFGASAGIDTTNPTALIVNVAQGGTLLPERDYYLRNDAAMQLIRDQDPAYLRPFSGSPAVRLPGFRRCWPSRRNLRRRSSRTPSRQIRAPAFRSAPTGHA